MSAIFCDIAGGFFVRKHSRCHIDNIRVTLIFWYCHMIYLHGVWTQFRSTSLMYILSYLENSHLVVTVAFIVKVKRDQVQGYSCREQPGTQHYSKSWLVGQNIRAISELLPAQHPSTTEATEQMSRKQASRVNMLGTFPRYSLKPHNLFIYF